MAKAFLKLDTRRALKDGTYMVRIGVGYGTDLYLSTGISVAKDNWDDRTKLYTGKGAKRINDTLAAILTRVNNTILELRETGQFSRLDKNQLKQILTDGEMSVPEKPHVPTLGEMFDRVIATKNKRNAQLFAQTLQKLTAWRDVYRVPFDEITKMWLSEFYGSMSGLAINTKAIHMRNLRNVINFAIDENITQCYPFRNFHIPTEETEMRVLPVIKLRYYKDMAHLSAYDREHRDMFLLMFYLIGINIVDLSRLTPDNYVNGRIEYRRAKTGKLYSIKVEAEAREIIKAYRGEKHLLRCFDRYKDYKDYAAHLNAALRRLGPAVKKADGTDLLTGNNLRVMVPIEPRITSYWARYSWATYAAALDIPKDTISEALGHEYGSRITGVYIKFSRDKIDAANRKVIDYVLGG